MSISKYISITDSKSAAGVMVRNRSVTAALILPPPSRALSMMP